MKLIPLTQGKFAKVSDNWFTELNKHKWCAWYNPHTKSFYAIRRTSVIFGKSQIYMHRVVAGATKSEKTDHKDHDTLNNQEENLRNCTNSQNLQNSKKRVDNTSGYKGVSHGRGNKWRARIQIDKKNIVIGQYNTAEDAAHAYDERAKELFGEYAHLNFPEAIGS